MISVNVPVTPRYNYTEAHGLNSNYVYSFYEDADGVMWIGTLEGLCKVENGLFEKITTFDDGYFLDAQVDHFQKDPLSDDIWMSSANGLLKIHDGQVFSVTDDDGQRGFIKHEHSLSISSGPFLTIAGYVNGVVAK